MTFIEVLQQLDQSIFFFFNQTLSNPVFDWVMPHITSPITWIPVYLLLCIYLIRQKRIGIVCLLTIIVAFIIVDPLTSRYLKFAFERVRPCRALQGVHLLVECGVGQSFPSTHAANSFAIATVFSLFYRRFALVSFSCATLIALSRMFVGVHYFFDIFGGAVVGISIGYLCYILAQWSVRKFNLDTKQMVNQLLM
jgi:undecaprenyl-diphosphatase